MIPLDDWTARISALDAALRPIANRAIDITELDWVEKLKNFPNPLDEAGVRAETEQLLIEIIARYASSDEEGRAAIRNLIAEHKSFRWAATLSSRPITAEGFRAHLLLFSIKDQGSDTRDAIVLLQSLCEQARSSGVKIAPILNEIAQVSSYENKYGMGSTVSLLRNEYERSLRT